MSRPLRLPGACLAVALLLPVAGCGENSIDDYCAALKSDQKQIAEMLESTSATALLTHLPMLRDLADQAPEDLADEWQTFVGAVDGLQDALDEADVKASDFEDGKPPAGLSAEDRQAITAAADQMATADVSAAASGIDQQARDVCKINLGLG